MKKILIVLTIVGALSASLSAETLLVERAQRDKGAVPNRGQTMSQVEAQYGAPTERQGPVPVNPTPRNPPITTWVYPAFKVYFEHNHVINTVMRKSTKLELGPKPAPAQTQADE